MMNLQHEQLYESMCLNLPEKDKRKRESPKALSIACMWYNSSLGFIFKLLINGNERCHTTEAP